MPSKLLPGKELRQGVFLCAFLRRGSGTNLTGRAGPFAREVALGPTAELGGNVRMILQDSADRRVAGDGGSQAFVVLIHDENCFRAEQ